MTVFLRICVALLILSPLALRAQSPENLLLIMNESSPLSLETGLYYAERRGIPAGSMLRIRTSMEDQISRQDYQRQVEAPIAEWLSRNSAQDRVLYLVLTKGVPLRIQGSSGQNGTVASVDSELSLLYRRMAGLPVPAEGFVKNPYFLADRPVTAALKFTHKAQDIFLVCRLDGFTGADIRGLIDRGLTPGREGTILLDAREGSATSKGNAWLIEAAERLKAMGYADRVVLDTTARVLADQQGVLGYYSWGSNDPAIRRRDFNLGFLPGALAAMFVSSDGRTFAEPPAGWNIGEWEDRGTHFAASPQSLAADLIRAGATGVAGHVAEPYLEATIRPEVLFPAYLSGFNLAEAFYLAMPLLSWQTVVVGDPLCAPFRSKPMPPAEIDPGIDPETELPRLFSSRRSPTLSVQLYRQARVHPDTVKALLRAEVRMAKGDRGGARRALESATAADDRLLVAQMTLASLYEEAGEYDKAVQRYRRVLEMTPDSPVALNNLAYALAVRMNSPREALPLAERAYTLGKGNPNLADTLGWIHYLLGDHEKASTLLEEAVKGAPENALIHLHAAVSAEASGQPVRASALLKRALELEAALEQDPEARKLRAKLPPSP